MTTEEQAQASGPQQFIFKVHYIGMICLFMTLSQEETVPEASSESSNARQPVIDTECANVRDATIWQHSGVNSVTGGEDSFGFAHRSSSLAARAAAIMI